MRSRQDRISDIKSNPDFSVLIVGAGINGIGTFRELALQNIDVLMIDKHDYCSGTSAASSHMVHGGIRYLEFGELRLVQEAVRERNRLIENAPHLVKPLPTVFPIFKRFSGFLNAPLKFVGISDRPAERGALVIKIGMVIYDFFARKQRTVPRHVFRNRSASLDLFPSLNPNILYTGTYYDGSMASPERIAIELITDSLVSDARAIPLNYVRLKGIGSGSIIIEDELTGQELEVRPKVVVNACGPWIDEVNRLLDLETRYIGGTKGSHLVLDHPELRRAIDGHEFFFENEDGRIVLIYPLEDRVLVGTSDIRTQETDPGVVSEEEVDYFLSMIQRVFPDISADRSHIVFTFSGIRPLAFKEGTSTDRISRDHRLISDTVGNGSGTPVVSLVGGKWTTFRAISEQAADQVLDRLESRRIRSTRNMAIGGGAGYPGEGQEREQLVKSAMTEAEISRDVFAALFERYGTKAVEMVAQGSDGFKKQLEYVPGLTAGEVEHILEHEDVVHLSDLVLRRTSIGKLGKTTPEGLIELAELCKSHSGWDRERTALEIEQVVDVLRARHTMDLGTYVPHGRAESTEPVCSESSGA